MSKRRNRVPVPAPAAPPGTAAGAAAAAEARPAIQVIKVARDGDWLAADEFREACAQAADGRIDVHIDLEGLEHLDASALQILLALRVKQQRNDRRLSLINPSASLLRWFEFAGAARLFSMTPAC